MDVNSSLNIWQNLPVKLSGLGLLLGGFFFFVCLFVFITGGEGNGKILVWKIPWTEEPGGLHSTGLQRVGHD